MSNARTNLLREMTSNSPSTWDVSEGKGKTSIRDSEVVYTHQVENQNKKDPESVTPDENIPLEPLSDQERHLLFDKGIKFKKHGNNQHALHCLLACVRGLKDGSTFQLLPECLHNIAEIYSSLGDYENAVSFVQAEKLYYETFLINVSNETQKGQVIDGIANGPTHTTTSEGVEAVKPVSDGVKDPQATSAEARSANEYENLAHMCLKKKDAQLALEYCGKAVKLRQSIYGEQHPVTKRTLDLFTVIYAEMGKEQYTAAMQKFNESKQGDHAELNHESPEGKSVTISEESRSQTTLGSSEEERSTTTPETINNHKTVSVTPGQGMLLFFLFTALVAIGVTLFCCHITGIDSVSTYRYIVTRLKFYYYYYFRQTPGGERFF